MALGKQIGQYSGKLTSLKGEEITVYKENSFMKRTLIGVLGALGFCFAVTQAAVADHCDELAGHQLCVKLCASTTGDCSEYTASFGVSGSFQLGSGLGTYTCKGSDFVEANFLFNGSFSHVLYAEARSHGKKIFGHGKGGSTGFLYSLKSKKPSAC